MGFDAPGERNLGAAFLAHECGEAARKLSLVRRGKRLVQHFGNGETQHTIAKKFEPLVGFPLASRHRAHMCECRRDQFAIGENMPDALLDRFQIPVLQLPVLPRHPISRF